MAPSSAVAVEVCAVSAQDDLVMDRIVDLGDLEEVEKTQRRLELREFLAKHKGPKKLALGSGTAVAKNFCDKATIKNAAFTK